jgi:hypothetical protein
MTSVVATRAWRVVRATTRLTEAVVAPEVVAATPTIVACSYHDTTSMMTARSQEAVDTAWTMAMDTTKSDRATSEVAEAMATVSGSKVGGVAMMKVGSEWIWAGMKSTWA